jgi:hypothetical protein
MMLLTVQVTYKDGRIELSERPENIAEAARVLVTFLAPCVSGEIDRLEEAGERETLRQRAFARMKEGIHLGGTAIPQAREAL